MSRYGPPIPPDPWPTVTIGHPSSSKDPERVVPMPQALVNQRRQINALAYIDALEPFQDDQAR